MKSIQEQLSRLFSWAHESILLHSLNPQYEDIELTEDDEPRKASFFVSVIG